MGGFLPFLSFGLGFLVLFFFFSSFFRKLQPVAELGQRAQLSAHTQHTHTQSATHNMCMWTRHITVEKFFGMARGWPLIFMAISFNSFACTFPCKVVNSLISIALSTPLLLPVYVCVVLTTI